MLATTAGIEINPESTGRASAREGTESDAKTDLYQASSRNAGNNRGNAEELALARAGAEMGQARGSGEV